MLCGGKPNVRLHFFRHTLFNVELWKLLATIQKNIIHQYYMPLKIFEILYGSLFLADKHSTGDFAIMTNRSQTSSFKEISHVVLAAMVLAPNVCNVCQ